MEMLAGFGDRTAGVGRASVRSPARRGCRANGGEEAARLGAWPAETPTLARRDASPSALYRPNADHHSALGAARVPVSAPGRTEINLPVDTPSDASAGVAEIDDLHHDPVVADTAQRDPPT